RKFPSEDRPSLRLVRAATIRLSSPLSLVSVVGILHLLVREDLFHTFVHLGFVHLPALRRLFQAFGQMSYIYLTRHHVGDKAGAILADEVDFALSTSNRLI